MTDWELERRLAAAVERAAPDDLDVILSRCGAQQGSVTNMKHLRDNVIDVEVAEMKTKKRTGRWLAAACAALALLGAGGGLWYHQSCAVASVVSLDVNPSIELKVNRKERVVSCSALNTEAAAVLFDMDGGADLKGADVNVAVNAIVGALVREGYLDSISSAILISVEDKDQERAARLQAELVASVDGALQNQAPGTSVLSQVVEHDPGYLEYGNRGSTSSISNGKAALVDRVISQNFTITGNALDVAYEELFGQLSSLSVEELNDLLKTGETRIPIGKSAAGMAAETYAGTSVLSSNVVQDVDPEVDEGVYEVELRLADGREFEYIVDAFTGAVLRGQKDILSAPATTPSTPSTGAQPPATTPSTGTQPPETPPSTPSTGTQPPVTAPSTPGAPANQDVGQAAAKQAALSHAGLPEGQVYNLTVERDWDNGCLEYEIEFWCGSTEYDYTVDGYTCSILGHKQEHHTLSTDTTGGHHSDSHSSGTPTGTSNDIGQAAAKQAALNHAGLSESQVTRLIVERDWDDGRLEYEVKFHSGRMEYEYTIDGGTGAILEHEWDD